jgi:ABC-type branched-subunit amino acid transport system substrate-binding protein
MAVNGAHTTLARPTRRVILLGSVALTLGACGGGSGFGGPFKDDSQPEPESPGLPDISAAGTKVALLLPLTAQGETRDIAKALKQSAEMALVDYGGGGVALLTKDTGGSASGAKAAAEAAMGEGAKLILGPLLAPEVSAVSPVARARGISVVAFSSVSATAGNGTFLMSFLPEEEVSNVVRYAASKGVRNIAALYPANPYGDTVQRALVRATQANRGTVAAAERYNRERGALDLPATKISAAIADSSRNIEALMIPEGGAILKGLSDALAAHSVTSQSLKILGTGLWDDRVTPSTPIAQGGWYAGVSPDLVASYESKYSSSYGVKPPRIASLAYDAVSLAINLSKSGDFSAGAIANPSGFQGQNGLFRFRSNGLIQRGLSILEMTSSGPQVIAPAPERFGSGSS